MFEVVPCFQLFLVVMACFSQIVSDVFGFFLCLNVVSFFFLKYFWLLQII